MKRDVRNAGEEHDRTEWRSAEGDRQAVAVASHLNRDVRGREIFQHNKTCSPD